MAVKLKTKITLGSIFLFVLLVIVGAVNFYYLNRISAESRQIVKNNYETLSYSREMLDELNTAGDSVVFERFEKTLQLQEKNITEKGEKELTESLRKNFNELKRNGKKDSMAALIRKDIAGIMMVNLKAIDFKNQAAQASAEKAKTIITICLTVCLLVGFTFLYNFPANRL